MGVRRIKRSDYYEWWVYKNDLPYDGPWMTKANADKRKQELEDNGQQENHSGSRPRS